MSISKNYFYNLSYQISVIIIPFITIPYISRVLGTEGVGIYAFANSIVQYFGLIATLGISTYAFREIARVKDNAYERSKIFIEILSLQIITSFVAIILYLLFVIEFSSNHPLVQFILVLNLIAVTLDISWFYIGIEDFKKNATRNILAKIIAFCLLFIFVKSENDLWKFVLLNAGSVLVGHIFLWKDINKYVVFGKIEFKRIRYHFFKSLNMFYIIMIGTISANLNKTLIGSYINQSELGKYDIAYRLVLIILTFTTGIGTVILPKISYYLGQNDFTTVKAYLQKSISFTLSFSVAAMVGLIGIASNFTEWFLSSKFEGTDILFMILSPMILLNSLSNFLSTSYMIPSRNEKMYVKSLVIGSVVGTIASFILIPKYSIIGACISVIILEVVILIVHTLQVKKLLPIYLLFKEWWKYGVAGILLFLAIKVIERFINAGILLTVFQVIGGTLLYCCVIVILKTEEAKYFIDQIKKYFGRMNINSNFKN